jgi:uncharacterized protein (DUF2141 family)
LRAVRITGGVSRSVPPLGDEYHGDQDSAKACDFESIPPGTYAMVVVHDENMNGKLDTNWLGRPKEGYGFSNDAKSLARAPSFSDASFAYDGQNVNLTMTLRY